MGHENESELVDDELTRMPLSSHDQEFLLRLRLVAEAARQTVTSETSEIKPAKAKRKIVSNPNDPYYTDAY